MRYGPAIAQAWDSLSGKAIDNLVRFLDDEYRVDVTSRQVAPVRRRIPVDDALTLLILHYVARRLEGLPAPAGEWLSLSELSLAAGFADVFIERAVGPLRREFGADPERIYAALEKVPGERVPRADVALVLEVLEGVPMVLEIWRADEDFEAEAGLLFDRSITKVFCTEDILVLAEIAVVGVVDRCGISD